MDKSGIPTVKITVGEKEVSVYKWFTAEEENEHRSLIMGNKEFDISDEMIEKGNMKTTLSFDGVAKANRYIVEHLCVDLKWEEYNIWSPDMRLELLEKINKVKEGKK